MHLTHLTRLLVLSLALSGTALAQSSSARDVAGGPARPAPAYHALRAADAASLRGAERPDLTALRGGVLPARAGLDGADRAALRNAELRTPNLEQMRGAGLHLSDHDLQLVLITVGIVILAIIIF